MEDFPQPAPDPQKNRDLAALSRQARVYLLAGAWQSAHDLLRGQLSARSSEGALPPEAIECFCLQIAACAQLGHTDRVARGCERLSRMAGRDTELSSERRLLTAYCFSVRDANEGNYARARARTQKALASVDEDVTPWTRSRVEILLGRINFRDGDLQATERHALEAAQLGNVMESEAVRGDAHSMLAAVAKARGALGEAEVMYARAARQYWRGGNRSACAVVQLSRAAVLNQWGLPSDGSQELRECLRTAMSLGRKATALRARLGLGWTAARQGDLAVARQGLLSAWREARRLLLTREEALALEYLSETYILKGTLPEARVATRLCRRLAERIAPMGDIVLEIGIREAMLALAQGHPRDAVFKARAAIRHAKRAEMPWERAQAYRVLGVAYVRLGRKQQARKAFLAARELFDTMGEKLELPVVEAWLKALDRPSAEQAGKPESGDQDSASDALRFWLQHPLLGPEPWLASKGRRKSVARGSAMGHKRQPVSTVHPIWVELGLVARTPAVIRAVLFRSTARLHAKNCSWRNSSACAGARTQGQCKTAVDWSKPRSTV